MRQGFFRSNKQHGSDLAGPEMKQTFSSLGCFSLQQNYPRAVGRKAQPCSCISYLASEPSGKQEPTRLGAEWLAVLLGQEKSSIWLLSRIPEGVMRPLPKGRFRELGAKVPWGKLFA